MVMFDVVEEILSRLLANDLLRCKSVCKSWHSLITSPSFVRLQCKYSCNNNDHNRRIAMCKPYPNPYTELVNRNIEFRLYNSWTVGGSSNGLVCMYESWWPEGPLRVINPLTRKFREQLGKPPRLDNGYNRCLGFGYDSSTDDYKVVMAISKPSDRRALVHILYLKSSIWKLLGHFNYRFKRYEIPMPGILFNGILHWFWFDINDTMNNKSLIVSFDLAKEEFKEIPQPDDTRYVWDNGSTLGIIEGRLCIFNRYTNNNAPFCVWVMKNYNVKPSWELLPITDPSEMKDHAIHYMLKDDIQYPYYCDENIQLAKCEKYISSPIFVQTLVSPYVNDNERPSYAEDNNNTVKVRSVKEKREIEEEENGSKEKRKIVEILLEEEGEGGKRTSQRIITRI